MANKVLGNATCNTKFVTREYWAAQFAWRRKTSRARVPRCVKKGNTFRSKVY